MKSPTLGALLVLALGSAAIHSQPATAPYRLVPNWGTLPGGAVWGEVPGMAIDANGKIFAFHPDGQLLMSLGTKATRGEGPDLFAGPCDVAVAGNGDIFVADGHVNSRIVKFSKDGTFIKACAKDGSVKYKIDDVVAEGVAVDTSSGSSSA